MESLTASEAIVNLSDGTRMRLVSAAGNLGFDPVTNRLTGTVSEASRTDATGAVTYEAITNVNRDAGLFSPNFGPNFFSIFNGDDTLIGWSGVDVLIGSFGNDMIEGGAGDDWIEGNQGGDTITGGDGNDTINGGEGDDTLTGGDGNDSINGGDGTDQVTGGAGNDILRGDGLVDGGDGDDDLAGAGIDAPATVLGGAGNDFIGGFDNGQNDIIDAGTGDDQILLSPGNTGAVRTVTLGAGVDTIAFAGGATLEFNVTVTDFTPGPGFVAKADIAGNVGATRSKAQPPRSITQPAIPLRMERRHYGKHRRGNLKAGCR